MSLPDDILNEEIWRYLPAQTLLKYCQTNKTINSICNRNELWQRLIIVDFCIEYFGEDSKDEYTRLYHFKEIQLTENLQLFNFTEILKDHGAYGFTSIVNHFLGTEINLKIHLFNKYKLARDLIDFFRKTYIPKSFQHEWDNSQLFTTSLSELVGNKA